MRIAELVSRILPEGQYKEGLRRIFYDYHNPLYPVNKIIGQSALCPDGMLFIRLNNGFQCYGLPDGGEYNNSFRFGYGNPQKLDRLNAVFGLFYYHLYEQFIQNIYEREYHLQKGDVAIDVGAAFGINAIIYSKQVGDEGKVISIEPAEDNLMCLKKNIELNKLKNVTVIQKGLWSKKDRLRFYLKPVPGGHSLVTDKDDAVRITEVEVDTLDNILTELGIYRVNFIKMDIEGAEIEALRGMEETLENNDVKLAIASYHKVNGQPTYKTIIPMMREMGFNFHFKDGISYFEKW